MKFPHWIQNHQQWLYLGIVSAISLTVIYLTIPFKGHFQYDYRLGQVWLDETIVAPVDFVVPKSPGQLSEEKEILFKERDLIYDIGQPEEQWKEVLIKVTDSAQASAIIQELTQTALVLTHPKPIHATLLSDFTYIDLTTAYTLGAVKQRFQLPDSIHLEPTFTLNTTLTDSLLNHKYQALTPNRGIIAQGTPILPQGATITQESFELLKALEAHYNGSLKGLDWRGKWGAFLYILLVFTGLAAYLGYSDQNILLHSSSLNLFYFTFTILGALTLIFASTPALNVFAVPLLLFPVIIRSFFNARIALVGHFFLLLLSAPFIGGATYFVAIQFAAGLSTLLNIKGIYKRSQLFQSTLRIILTLILAHLSVHLIRQNPWSWTYGIPAISSIAGTFILLFVFPLIYFFERIFGVVSDLTLLELSDMNNPLLKRLSKEAPGTFQHTMQVANLAEHAAELVNGNTLMVRTGALYHDIGKIVHPQYFTENQVSSHSPHDDLSYLESAQIIIGHVAEGIELAKKHRLPDIIIDFIRTHHGTSRVEYFYRKFKEDHPDLNQFSQFQYPGPKPFSKETAIVMMSDAVEASTRSIPDKTQDALCQMIDKIIDHQLQTGQLDNADITLKEIGIIREAFKKFVRGVYHLRIEYPEDK